MKFEEEQMTRCYSNKVLLLIIILAAALRLATLDYNDLWHDEYLSIFASRMEVKDLIKTLQIYTVPPLFYLLLKGWFALTDGLFHPRMFTVLWAIAGVCLTYLLGRRLLGREVGLIGALLVAVAPYHIRYSQELRMYIMQTTLLTAETLALLAALHKGKPTRWLVYGLLVALNLSIKYQSVFYCFVEWAFIFVYAIVSRNRTLLRGVIIAALIGEILLSPIIWLGARQLAMADLGLGWVLPTHPTDFLRCFLITLFYYMLAFKESWWMWAVSTIIILVVLIGNWKTWRTEKEKFALSLLLTLTFGPALIMFVLSLFGFRIFFLTRYVILFLIPYLLLLAGGIYKIKWQFVRTIVFAFVAFGLLATSLVQGTKKWYPSWKHLTEIIDRYVKDDDLLLANHKWWMSGYYYYSKRQHPVINFNDLFNNPKENPERFYLFQNNMVGEIGFSFPAYLPAVLKNFSQTRIIYLDHYYTFSYHEKVEFEKFREYVKYFAFTLNELETREDFVYKLFASDLTLDDNYQFTPAEYGTDLWPFRYLIKDKVKIRVPQTLQPGFYQLRLRGEANTAYQLPKRDVKIKIENLTELTATAEDYLFWYYSLPFMLNEAQKGLTIEIQCPTLTPAKYYDTTDDRKLGLRFYWLILANIDLEKFHSKDEWLFYYDLGSPVVEDDCCIGQGVYSPVGYYQDQSYRTTNGNGEFFLPVDVESLNKIQHLVINMRYTHPDPDYLPVVQIRLNNSDIGEVQVEKNFGNYYFSDISKLLVAEVNRLQVLSPTWVPAEIMASTDERKLGVQVNFIAFK